MFTTTWWQPDAAALICKARCLPNYFFFFSFDLYCYYYYLVQHCISSTEDYLTVQWIEEFTVYCQPKNVSWQFILCLSDFFGVIDSLPTFSLYFFYDFVSRYKWFSMRWDNMWWNEIFSLRWKFLIFFCHTLIKKKQKKIS